MTAGDSSRIWRPRLRGAAHSSRTAGAARTWGFCGLIMACSGPARRSTADVGHVLIDREVVTDQDDRAPSSARGRRARPAARCSRRCPGTQRESRHRGCRYRSQAPERSWSSRPAASRREQLLDLPTILRQVAAPGLYADGVRQARVLLQELVLDVLVEHLGGPAGADEADGLNPRADQLDHQLLGLEVRAAAAPPSRRR